MRQAEGRNTVPGMSNVRKNILKGLYSLILDKPPTNFSKQSISHQQKDINLFFNVQHEKLKPVVMHSNMCCHGEKDGYNRAQ